MQMNRSRLAGGLVALGLGATGAIVTGPASAQAADIEIFAHMRPTSSYPNAHGGARYESHPGWREFEINVRGIQKLAGKTVTVRVHGTFVGRTRVSPHGRAHLHKQSGLPSMAAGDAVRVRNKSGTLVSRGKFRSMHHHGMMW